VTGAPRPGALRSAGVLALVLAVCSLPQALVVLLAGLSVPAGEYTGLGGFVHDVGCS